MENLTAVELDKDQHSTVLYVQLCQLACSLLSPKPALSYRLGVDIHLLLMSIWLMPRQPCSLLAFVVLMCSSNILLEEQELSKLGKGEEGTKS